MRYRFFDDPKNVCDRDEKAIKTGQNIKHLNLNYIL